MSRYFDVEQTSKTCRRCGTTGHDSKSCGQKFEDFARCLVCGEQGHLSTMCPNKGAPPPSFFQKRSRSHHEEFPEDDQEGAICVSCGERNHVNCTLLPLIVDAIVETCARCGNKGHTDLTCTNTRRLSNPITTTTTYRRPSHPTTPTTTSSHRRSLGPSTRMSFPPMSRGGGFSRGKTAPHSARPWRGGSGRLQ